MDRWEIWIGSGPLDGRTVMEVFFSFLFFDFSLLIHYIVLSRRVYFWGFGLLDDWLLYVGLSIFMLIVNMEPRLSSSTVSCFVARNSINCIELQGTVGVL